MPDEEEGVFHKLLFSPDDQSLAVLRMEPKLHPNFSYCQPEILLLNLMSGQTHKLTGHTGILYAYGFSPDGEHFFSSSQAGEAFLWELATGERQSLVSGDAVRAFAFSPDGRLLAFDQDSTLHVRDLKTGAERTLLGSDSFAYKLLFSPDGESLASISDDNSVHLWSLSTGQMTHTLRGHRPISLDLAFSPDGRTLATSGYDHELRLWDLASSESRVLRGHAQHVLKVLFACGGDYLVSAGADHMIKIWREDLPKEPSALREWLQTKR